MTTVTNHRTPCPLCAYPINAHTPMEGCDPPAQGDVTVCLQCCGVLMFTKELELETVAIESLPEPTQRDLRRAIRLIHYAKVMKSPDGGP